MGDKTIKRGSGAVGRAGAIGLDKRQVVRAAITLIDEKGLAAFSTRELSLRLGVYPATIYWHIGGGREDLFSEISAEITANLMRPEDTCGDWREAIRAVFHRYRDEMFRHPNLAPLLGAQMLSNGPPNAGWIEGLLTTLQQAGYRDAAMVDAFNALIGGLCGFVTMELAQGPSRDVEAWRDSFERRMDALDTERFPLTGRMLPQMRNRAFVLRCRSGSESPLDGGFDHLLEHLIAGLEAGLERRKAAE